MTSSSTTQTLKTHNSRRDDHKSQPNVNSKAKHKESTPAANKPSAAANTEVSTDHSNNVNHSHKGTSPSVAPKHTYPRTVVNSNYSKQHTSSGNHYQQHNQQYHGYRNQSKSTAGKRRRKDVAARSSSAASR